MLSASIEFRNKIAQNSTLMVKATLKLRNGETVELTGDDIIMGGMSFTEATSSGNSFDIGAAVVGSLDCDLNNFDGRFDEFDFTDAQLTPYLGMPMDDGTTEWIRKGYYNVEQPSTYGGTINLKCYDNLIKLDKPYADVKTTYPATAMVIVSELAKACNLTIATSSFKNSGYVIQYRPEDEAMTCRDVLSYVMQITCNYAKADAAGHIYIGWYDKDVFDREDSLDGKWFDDATPYASGDTADGGNFTTYSVGEEYDGGTFAVPPYAVISATSSQTIGLDDVVITGVQVTSADRKDKVEQGEPKKEEVFYGEKGYVLTISNNPFINYGSANQVATMIGQRVVGLRFRLFDVSAIGSPVIEAGDGALIIDAAQKQYRSFITQLTYKPGSYESFSCKGETPARNSATNFSALTKALVEAAEKVDQERTDREKALEDLQRVIEDSSGLYKTEERQADGSTIYYLHDKPTLEGSMIVWKITAEAIAISSDGGHSWPYGLTVDGNTILNRIYAIGLDADYITTGRITDHNKNGNFWDLDTGEFRMASSYTKVTDDKGNAITFDEYVAENTKDSFATATSQQVFDKLTNSGKVQGLYMNNGGLYINASHIGTGVISDATGNMSWNLTNGEFRTSKSSSDYIALNYSVFDYYHNGKRVGYIGSAGLANNNSVNGLLFGLTSSPGYMGWAASSSYMTTTTLRMTLIGESGFSTTNGRVYSALTLYHDTDVDFNNYKILKAKIEDSTGSFKGTLYANGGINTTAISASSNIKCNQLQSSAVSCSGWGSFSSLTVNGKAITGDTSSGLTTTVQLGYRVSNMGTTVYRDRDGNGFYPVLQYYTRTASMTFTRGLLTSFSN